MAYSNDSEAVKYCKFNLNFVALKLHNSGPSGPQGLVVVSKFLGKTY
jgi:hypothetical protein